MKEPSSLFNGKTFIVFAITFAVGYAAVSASINSQVSAARARDKAAVELISQKGVMAYDFTLPSLEGDKISLSSLRGKWVFLNFWATWCGPCVVEMPMMNKLYNELKNEPFEMIAVSIDEAPADKVKRFAKELEIDFTVLLDRSNDAARQYGIISIPFTLIINPKGEIVTKASGMREWDSPEVIDYLRGLMKDTPPAELSEETA